MNHTIILALLLFANEILLSQQKCECNAKTGVLCGSDKQHLKGNCDETFRYACGDQKNKSAYRIDDCGAKNKCNQGYKSGDAVCEQCICTSKNAGKYCGADAEHLTGYCELNILYQCANNPGEIASNEKICAENEACVDEKNDGNSHCQAHCSCQGRRGHFCGSDNNNLIGNCNRDALYMCESVHKISAKLIEVCGGIHHCTNGSMNGHSYCDE